LIERGSANIPIQKNRGKCAVGGQDERRNAIGPIKYVKLRIYVGFIFALEVKLNTNVCINILHKHILPPSTNIKLCSVTSSTIAVFFKANVRL
jgi:hypothetical protein